MKRNPISTSVDGPSQHASSNPMYTSNVKSRYHLLFGVPSTFSTVSSVPPTLVPHSPIANSVVKKNYSSPSDNSVIDLQENNSPIQTAIVHSPIQSMVVSVDVGPPSLRNIIVSSNERQTISTLMGDTRRHTLLIEKFAIDMTVSKIQCLAPATWLNDEVINFYFEMLLNTSTTMYAFSSFFMQQLLIKSNCYNFANVKRWTKKVDIFLQKIIFIPINMRNFHWTLIIINIEMKSISYYDSYRKSDMMYVNAALKVCIICYAVFQ